MGQPPEDHIDASTSNSYSGQAENVVQAGKIMGDVIFNAGVAPDAEHALNRLRELAKNGGVEDIGRLIKALTAAGKPKEVAVWVDSLQAALDDAWKTLLRLRRKYSFDEEEMNDLEKQQAATATILMINDISESVNLALEPRGMSYEEQSEAALVDDPEMLQYLSKDVERRFMIPVENLIEDGEGYS
jgi:hypothetical protein